VQFTVPVQGGYRASFEGHRAVVPDDVADFLLAMGAGFYSLTGDVQEALTSGATVLVIRDTGLGDVLLLTPMIRKLAQIGCIVDVLTQERYRCLFGVNPSVRATLALEDEPVDRTGYDVVLDLRLVVENAEFTGHHEHRADAFARCADISLSPDERALTYCVNGDERAAAMRLIEDCRTALPCKGVVGYVWRSSTENRNWSFAQHKAVLEALIAAGYCPIVLDNEYQNLLSIDGSVVNETGTHNLREVAAILEQCDAVITPDTGLFHLAGAVDTPTLSYFGAFPAAERQAHRNLTVWNAPPACSLFPCRSYRCLNRDGDNQAACLAVSPEQVVRDVEELLKEKEHVTSGLGRSDHDGGAAAEHERGDGAGEPDRELDHDPAPAAPVPDPAEVREAAPRKRRTARKSDARSLL
jgi:ADP-heptose:LPS heptosyltransferase